MARQTSARKRVVFALLPTAALLLVAFIAAETTLRIRYGRIERITGVAPWKPAEWEGMTYFWDQYHPTLGWTNVPGYRSDERVPYQVTINQQGLRATREYDPKPPPGTYRIALFGDSCAFGEEVDDPHTPAAYLEQHLANTEVLNFGVHGYGVGQMMLLLEEQGFDLNPDHVVFLVLLPEDPARDRLAFSTHDKPVFTVDEAGELVIENTPVPEATRQPWMQRHCFTYAWLLARPRIDIDAGGLQAHMHTMAAIVRRAAAACAEREIEFSIALIVVPGTSKGMLADPRVAHMIDYMRRATLALDVNVVDLIDQLNALIPVHGRSVEAPHAHWSAKGNCLLAARLAQRLAAREPALSTHPNPPPCR